MKIVKIINTYLVHHAKEQYYFLLIALGLFLLIPPFTYHLAFSRLYIYGVFSFVVISCVVILSDNEKKLGNGIGALIVILAFTWFTIFPKLTVPWTVLIKMLLLIALFGLTIRKILMKILRLPKVNAQVLAGSVGAYLLIGLAGAMLFELVNFLFPGSFDYSFRYGGAYDMVYYSFVTLTTLGYGDITPHTPQGQSIAIFIAIIGQLYLAILMAMLVGKFLKDSNW